MIAISSGVSEAQPHYSGEFRFFDLFITAAMSLEDLLFVRSTFWGAIVEEVTVTGGDTQYGECEEEDRGWRSRKRETGSRGALEIIETGTSEGRQMELFWGKFRGKSASGKESVGATLGRPKDKKVIGRKITESSERHSEISQRSFEANQHNGTQLISIWIGINFHS